MTGPAGVPWKAGVPGKAGVTGPAVVTGRGTAGVTVTAVAERVAAYVRVSTEDQAEKWGAVVQHQRIDAYCLARGLAVPGAGGRYEDACSGKTMERPALSRLLEDVTAGKWDCVVAMTLDRWARNLRGLLHLVDEVFVPARCGLVCVDQGFDTSTPVGRLVMQVMGAVGEYDGHRLVERMVSGKRAARTSGQWWGGTPPFGYVVAPGGGLAHHPVHAGVVAEILALAPRIGHIGTLANLAARGVVRADGSPVSLKTLRNVVAHAHIYSGMIRAGGALVHGSHPPILAREAA